MIDTNTHEIPENNSGADRGSRGKSFRKSNSSTSEETSMNVCARLEIKRSVGRRRSQTLQTRRVEGSIESAVGIG